MQLEGDLGETSAVPPVPTSTRLLRPRDQALGYVLVPARVVYYSVPKVACTSLKWQMAELQGEAADFRSIVSLEAAPELTVHDRHSWRRTPTIHEIAGSALEGWAVGDDWFRFAVLRDPIARAWSAWQSKILTHDPRFQANYADLLDFPVPQSIDDVIGAFGRFVELLASGRHRISREPHFAPQAQLLPLRDGGAGIRIYTSSRIGAMQQDLAEHLGRLGRALPPLRRSNEALFSVATSEFPRETVELLLRVYAVDYDTFPELVRPDLDVPRGTSRVPAEAVALLPQIWERNERIRDLAVSASRQLREAVR